MSHITVYVADEVCQNCYILTEKAPLIITIKWVRYIQNDTLANGENIQCPSIYFAGS